MERHFDEELREVRDRLLHMGSLAERMLALATRSIRGENGAAAAEVDRVEHEVNALDIEIDDRALKLIALRQPMAKDLRFLVMAMKITGELERIADQAVNIASSAALLLQTPLKPDLSDVQLMAELAQKMVRESLDSFVRADAARARAVLAQDDRVDALKDQVVRTLLDMIRRHPEEVSPDLSLILISRNLERVADHATNIAEEVIYLAEGRDVRHQHEKERRHEGAGPISPAAPAAPR